MNNLVLRVEQYAKMPDSSGMTYSRRRVSHGELPCDNQEMARELEQFFQSKSNATHEYRTELCVRVLKSRLNGGYVLVPVGEVLDAANTFRSFSE